MTPFVALVAPLLMTAAPAPQDTTYFQQGVDYTIEAVLDEAAETLHGRARLRYTNRAPAALDTLWFHQSLNAFRPNSAWARRELEFDERRFQDLGPDEHAFQRLTSVRVAGRAVEPVYPGAPDSTVVAVPLPESLEPGESVEVLLDWDARPSTLPRRQGRRGRHYDFAQWYPRIAVYDRGGWRTRPLLPQGEFYGEFARYDVTLDLAEDQIVGATGVPVEGEPGWKRAAAPGYAEVDYGRDTYALRPAESLGLLDDAAAGRKRVRWVAEDVHHFAWSTSPDYIYEGGQWEDVLIHVLYQPGDTAWAGGTAVERTAVALAWLDQLFGDYAYPQVTNVHRIESGGTEFPMMIMDGSASQGLILHEVGHIYAHGILANNEWLEGWLDEGMSSFQTSWYFEEHGQPDTWRRTMEQLAEVLPRVESPPIATPSADFPSFQVYGLMTYTKPAAVLRMLRELLGRDVMRQVLRTYYDEFELKHVREQDFHAVAERVSGRDLDWFFDQWLHTNALLDYAVADVRTRQVAGGEWETTVEVVRTGGAWMPVTLQLGETRRTLDARDARQVVTVRTPVRPAEVVVDPEMVLIDTDWSNNRKSL